MLGFLKFVNPRARHLQFGHAGSQAPPTSHRDVDLVGLSGPHGMTMM